MFIDLRTFRAVRYGYLLFAVHIRQMLSLLLTCVYHLSFTCVFVYLHALSLHMSLLIYMHCRHVCHYSFTCIVVTYVIFHLHVITRLHVVIHLLTVNVSVLSFYATAFLLILPSSAQYDAVDLINCICHFITCKDPSLFIWFYIFGL